MKKGDLCVRLSDVSLSFGRRRALSDVSLSLHRGEIVTVIGPNGAGKTTLLREPDLLVLDEPVQGVDVAGQAEIFALIRRIRDERQTAVLLVSHDLHLVMAATDEVVCLNHHVCCSGHPATVARDPAYRALFGDDAAAFALYAHKHDHAHDHGADPHG